MLTEKKNKEHNKQKNNDECNNKNNKILKKLTKKEINKKNEINTKIFNEDLKNRIVLGLIEPIKLIINDHKEELIARIDTGATKSSIDIKLASKLKLGPIISSKIVKNANGVVLRPLIKVSIEIAGKILTSKFSLADRSHLKYPVLIGQDILKQGFLIDPSRKLIHKNNKVMIKK